MKLNDITSFRLRGQEICKIYKGTNVIFNVCTGNYTWVMKQEINNPTPGYDDLFGHSVFLYQDTLVVGAYRDDTGATNAGSVYVYTRSGTSWSLQQTINNPSPASHENFGYSVSLYQDTLVVGTFSDASDSVYVYTRTSSTWTLQQTINNPSPASHNHFGHSVSLYQDTLVVEAFSAGTVYVYTRSGTSWSLQQTINDTKPGNNYFGYSVSLYQDTLVVGAYKDDTGATNAGSVYVYTRTGSTWTLQQTINNPTPTDDDYFGDIVSLYQDTLVIGASWDDTGAEEAGTVYVYTRSGTSWSLQQTINNPTPTDGDVFGFSISLYQDTLVIGAAWDDTEDYFSVGTAYVYTRSGTAWTLQQTINHPSPANNDNFGHSVSLYQDTLVVGAPYDDAGATDAGSVYVYQYEEI